MNRIFVLSPANCNGVRARCLLTKANSSKLAKRLRGSGVPLSEVFSFVSSLYFRGKVSYAQTFARPPADCAGIFIITPTMGLVPHDMLIRKSTLRLFSRGAIDVRNQLYCSSLRCSAKQLDNAIGSECEVVLLGSIASGKYLTLLSPIFARRLRVPAEFIGRGDMSRGGLLLRCVNDNRELTYIDVPKKAQGCDANLLRFSDSVRL
jgi:hypothetical protein